MSYWTFSLFTRHIRYHIALAVVENLLIPRKFCILHFVDLFWNVVRNIFSLKSFSLNRKDRNEGVKLFAHCICLLAYLYYISLTLRFRCFSVSFSMRTRYLSNGSQFTPTVELVKRKRLSKVRRNLSFLLSGFVGVIRPKFHLPSCEPHRPSKLFSINISTYGRA